MKEITHIKAGDIVKHRSSGARMNVLFVYQAGDVAECVYINDVGVPIHRDFRTDELKPVIKAIEPRRSKYVPSFYVGDIVRLKTNSPDLIVCHRLDYGHVLSVCWYDVNGKLHTGKFRREVLWRPNKTKVKSPVT